MKMSDKITGKVFIMPKIEAKYLNRAKKSELKVLYSVFMHGGEFDLQDICDETEESAETVGAALAFWRCAGVIDECEEKTIKEKSKSQVKKSSDEKTKADGAKPLYSYTLSEIASIKERDAAFGSLVDYFEKISGHLYNAAEQGIILYLYDTLGIDCELIMGVAQYCASLGKNSARYIQQAVMNLNDEGVKTYAEFEARIAAGKKKDDYMSMVKKLIGADDRALSKAEKTHIEKWQNEYKCSEELVSLAYEKTVAKINKPQVSYMSKILEGWYDKGLKTPEEVESFFGAGKKETKSEGSFEFSLEDIFEKPDLS